jgi:hypothetical protein
MWCGSLGVGSGQGTNEKLPYIYIYIYKNKLQTRLGAEKPPEFRKPGWPTIKDHKRSRSGPREPVIFCTSGYRATADLRIARPQFVVSRLFILLQLMPFLVHWCWALCILHAVVAYWWSLCFFFIYLVWLNCLGLGLVRLLAFIGNIKVFVNRSALIHINVISLTHPWPSPTPGPKQPKLY